MSTNIELSLKILLVTKENIVYSMPLSMKNMSKCVCVL